MRVRSSAPTRLDLAGGTLDIWPLYLLHEGARTLNVAITLRAECVLSDHAAGGLHATSRDTGAVLRAAHWSALTGDEEPRLVARLLRHFRAENLSLVTGSQSPVGAGLAGSSALNIALCAALAAWQRKPYEPEALIDLALNLEAQVIRAPTGAQDYRPAVYGGLACLELGPAGVRRRALPLDPRELDERIVVVYTGDSRNSGVNNWEIMRRHLDGDRQVVDALAGIRDVAVAMEGRARTARLAGGRPATGGRVAHPQTPGAQRLHADHRRARRRGLRRRRAGRQGVRRRRRRLRPVPGRPARRPGGPRGTGGRRRAGPRCPRRHRRAPRAAGVSARRHWGPTT